MNVGLTTAVAMLVVWVIGTVMWEAPGWFHGFLTIGVFLLIFSVVKRGTSPPKGK
jgi:hypothetical protein